MVITLTAIPYIIGCVEDTPSTARPIIMATKLATIETNAVFDVETQHCHKDLPKIWELQK